ncbi:MAG TPA: Glu/Leu/Phe/Val dehydrogenase [Vitreimonas sp.]|nr:Glu/Leu/Phe/Val dehydrogenase [Vitreimonas sp.]
MASNPHKNAVKQLDHVAGLLSKQYDGKLNQRFQAAINKLKTPDRVLETELKVKMDDGKTKTFQAYRSQHNNARGPYKGGIRFHPGVTKEEVMALSTWMTWKCAVTGIPYGGGKGGVIVDPQTLSATELQNLSRAYARFIAEHIGPWTDIPAPDVNTNGQIMAWMVDEWEQVMTKNLGQVLENPWATFTGKPLNLGGSQGREEATGLGGVITLKEASFNMGLLPRETTVAVQGFGNVGYWFAFHAQQRGYKVVALSDSKGAVYKRGGFDLETVMAHKQKTGSLKGLGDELTNEELLELKVNVLVPAALENVITAENADKIKAQLIVEMANGPVTPEADPILFAKDITVIPDVLANAGGVTTSYFEWVQNLHGYYWSHQDVVAKLEPLMKQAFDQMWLMKEKTHQDGRTATYLNAVKSVVDTMILRGRV